jgi:hypothetical protein
MALFKSFITPDSYSIVVRDAVEPEMKSRRLPFSIPEDCTMSSTSEVISMISVSLLVLKEITLCTIFIPFLIGRKGLKLNNPAAQNNGGTISCSNMH